MKHFHLRNAVYDALITGEGKIDDKGIIRIGKTAFFFGFDAEKGKKARLSASWLASSLFHESIHWDQQYGPKYRFGIGQGGTINDVEAYKAEIDNSKRFGLTPEEIKEVRSRYDRELRGLRPPYDDQVRKGDYSVPDIYQVPRVKH